jgi:alcohol dehydrogenase
MKAIVNTAPDQLALLDYALPDPGPNQVRIRTAACGICATDLHLIAGGDRVGFPVVPGHEWSGFIDAVGEGVDANLVGQRCVAENVLADGGEVGFEHPGGYGEYLLTESGNLHILPPDFPLATAALIEPLAVVIRATRHLRERGMVLISGDGPIGLLMLILLRHLGVERIAMIGGRTGRLALARSLGANATFNFIRSGTDLIPSVQQQMNGPFRAIVETSGSEIGLRTALQLITRGGQIILVGDYGRARADFPWNLMIHRELELVGSNASAGAWAEAVLLAQRLPLDRLISHRFPAVRFAEAFALVRGQGDNVVKVILEWS